MHNITWLNRQTREVAEQRLWDIMEHNGAAALRPVEYVESPTSYEWSEVIVVAYISTSGVIFGVSPMSMSGTTLWSSG